MTGLRKLRLLVFAEGKHEIGDHDWRTNRRLEGWIQPLLRRLLPNAQIQFEVRRIGEMLTLPRRAGQGIRQKGLTRKGHMAAWSCLNSDGMDAVLFVTDADSRDRGEWQQKIDDIRDGLGKQPEVVAIACVPKSTSESWLLCDADFWQGQLGLNAGNQLPGHPEDLWGYPHDPGSNHPKMLFERYCRLSGVEANAQTRARIADGMKLETWRQVCPVSGASFDRDLQQKLAPDAV